MCFPLTPPRLESSLASQQRTLTSYSHARQLEVVASLDTAEVAGEITSSADSGADPGNKEVAESESEQGGERRGDRSDGHRYRRHGAGGAHT